MSTAPEIERKEWTLEPQTEYRFELDPKSSVAIKLLSGHAEIFGAELVEGRPFLFGSECKAAVFTWQGCTLEISKPSTEYISEETPMPTYANLHVALEQMRVKALRDLHGSPRPEDEPSLPNPPPRVMLLGPDNYGKTSVAKLLVNYAVRAGQGWTPILVNLDAGDGGWTVPGTLSAAAIDAPIPTSSPATTLGSVATSAPMAVSSHALVPIVYWYGHTETRKNPLLLERLVRNLGQRTITKMESDPEVSTAGLIVDTPSSFVTGAIEDRQRLIKAAVETFQINVILVVGHEKLNVEMQRMFGASTVNIVKIPKSGGVVELDSIYREHIQNYQLHNYFYGEIIPPPSGTTSIASSGGEQLFDLALAPSSTVISFDDLKIYRIGAETMAPSSALPIGASRVLSEMQPVLIDPTVPGSGLLNAIAAIIAQPQQQQQSQSQQASQESSMMIDDEQLLDLTVTGLLAITHIDIPNRKYTILSPNQSPMAGRIAIVGTLEWTES